MENPSSPANPPRTTHEIPHSRTQSPSPPPSRSLSCATSNSKSTFSETPSPLKSAVILGAHTELGKLVLLNLLRHPLVSRIHALASVDPRADIPIHPDHFPKLRLILDSLDNIDQIVKTKIPPVQLAFCCLGSSKQDHSRLGPYAFRKLNYDIPRRFLYHIFKTEVQRIGILSHAQANIAARAEFLKVKGELVANVMQLLRHAGRHAPSVVLLRVPLLLTNLKDTNGLHGYKISRLDEIKQKAALRFEMGPTQAVHVRDVAKAMVADVIFHADMPPESDLSYRFRKHQYRLSELYGPDIVNLANEVRMAQRRLLSERFMKEKRDIPPYEHDLPQQDAGFAEGQPWPWAERMEDTDDRDMSYNYYAAGEYPTVYGNDDVPDPRVAQRGYNGEEGLFSAVESAKGNRASSIDVAGEPIADKSKMFESAIGSVEALAHHLGRPHEMEWGGARGWNEHRDRRERAGVDERVGERMMQADWLNGAMGERFGPDEAERWRTNGELMMAGRGMGDMQHEDDALWQMEEGDRVLGEDEDAHLQKRSFPANTTQGRRSETFWRHRAPIGTYVNSTDSLTSLTQGAPPLREKLGSTALGQGEADMWGGERFSDENGGVISEEYQPSREFSRRASHYETEQWVPSGNEGMEGPSTSRYSDYGEGYYEERPARESDWREHGVANRSAPGVRGLGRLGALVERVIAATDRPNRQGTERSKRGKSSPRMRRDEAQARELLIDDIRGNGDMRAAGQISI
eukprot:GFKZ01008065.1.p1 GENE.GFKZ01008065.1~~GFKZ01008065.1.p1  ORF type:complete len:744 (+),score=91.48 GFKZ01008065.1:133-2364(+)